MFCRNCGKEIADNAKYCPSCGISLTDREDVYQQRHDTGGPSIVLRPRFIGWVTLLSVLPIQIFMTIWGAIFCGGIGMFVLKALKLPLPPLFPFFFFGSLFFFGIPILVYFAKKKTYSKTEYKFYRDRLEYAEGFWTAEKKTIKYDNITETALRRGIIQKHYNLGTIFLATAATGFSQGRATSGMRVRDIKDPEKVYEEVQRLIGK